MQDFTRSTMDINLLPIIVFSFLSYLSLSFAGFGGILIPIALGATFYSIEWMLSILMPLTLVSNLYIIIRHYRQVDFRLFLRRIMPIMGVGLFIGIFLFQTLHGEMQERILGGLVIVLSLRELILLREAGRNKQPVSRTTSFFYMLSAGVIQGMYGSGGPLLVYVVNKLGLGKSAFRSTLSVVWLVMNTVLTASYILKGSVTLETVQASALLLPSLILGIMAGEFLHRRISDRIFRIVIYLLLLFSGFLIAFS